VIEGESLDHVINALIAEDQAARLVSLEESFG
jgi:protein subunit release factor A